MFLQWFGSNKLVSGRKIGSSTVLQILAQVFMQNYNRKCLSSFFCFHCSGAYASSCARGRTFLDLLFFMWHFCENQCICYEWKYAFWSILLLPKWNRLPVRFNCSFKEREFSSGAFTRSEPSKNICFLSITWVHSFISEVLSKLGALPLIKS